MSFKTFELLFHKVDTITATFVNDISLKCIEEITPVVMIGLTIWFIAYGLLIIRGAVDMPMTDFLAKSARIAIIVNIALAGGLYQSEIAGLIRTLPDDLATALITDPSQGGTAATLVDEAAGVGLKCAGRAFDMSGLFSFEGITYCVMGLIIFTMTIILACVGASFLLMAKVVLSLLAGLGPLFIVALVFPTTERFFNLWLAQVLNYVLMVVLYAAVFGFMITMFKGYMADMKFDEFSNVSWSVGGVCALCLCMLIVLRQLPSIASSLAGGVALSFERGKRLDNAFGRGAGAVSSAVSHVGNVGYENLRRSPQSSLPSLSAQGQASNTSSPLKNGYYKGNAMRAANTG